MADFNPELRARLEELQRDLEVRPHYLEPSCQYLTSDMSNRRRVTSQKRGTRHLTFLFAAASAHVAKRPLGTRNEEDNFSPNMATIRHLNSRLPNRLEQDFVYMRRRTSRPAARAIATELRSTMTQTWPALNLQPCAQTLTTLRRQANILLRRQARLRPVSFNLEAQ